MNTMKTKGLSAPDCGTVAAKVDVVMRGSGGLGLGNDVMGAASGRDWPVPVTGAGLGSFEDPLIVEV